ncbi:apurinic/apyrimidinic endonuclease family protein [Halobaculum gomorrense]|uniref:Xylose isomerase-like TIM barrel n=1 Tax=Halobaculum gomorrense TaxID=43928 RepID=A0A1M5UA47_9EURY|nr:TIM barrel protein [Halobaculum gomorrense]SHH59837.1 Xylose isomerase-like TIM barrel [Halobaculum gomorrense]
MSTQSSSHVRRAVATAEPVEAEPVTIDAAALSSTAPGDLRDLRAALADEGYVPAGIRVEAEFAADCSIQTQQEADRLRSLVRAASHLGAGELAVDPGAVADPEKVRPALDALAERAEREGVSLTIEGDAVALDRTDGAGA